MSGSAHNSSLVAGPTGRTASLPVPVLWLRFALVPIAVAICYLFAWHFLRALTADLNVGLDSIFGLRLERISPEYVLWHGVLYRYVVACTMVDVWFGSLPLIWHLRRSMLQNLAWIVLFALGLLAFNIFRLSVSDLLFSAGLSWNLAHNAVSGVAYFVVWLWLWNNRYSPLRGRHPAAAASLA